MNIELPEALLTREVAMRVRGCKSASTLWASIKDGTFPPPDKVIKRVRYWKESTLQNWLDSPCSE
jgi:predicted DNA-binding transcriptional regulator AlpA